MKICKELAQELLELSMGDDTTEWETDEGFAYPVKFKRVHTALIDTFRWSNLHEVVYLDLTTGKYWHSSYQVGATECQDEGAYDRDGDEIELTEVVPFEVITIKYKEVK